MTLEQAIKHCKEVASQWCDECAREHQQLAEWLEELVERRKQGWHPARKKPPVTALGNSEDVIAIDEDGDLLEVSYSIIYKDWMDDTGNFVKIKWWCYPPKE